MKKLLSILILFFSIIPTAKADWVRVFDNVYTDPTYIRVQGSLVSIWFKNVFNNGYNVTLDQYDCVNKTYRFIRYTSFDSTNQARFGEDVDWGYRNNYFKDVMPGSFVEKKFKVACSK